jgi:hypothetical protein
MNSAGLKTLRKEERAAERKRSRRNRQHMKMLMTHTPQNRDTFPAPRAWSWCFAPNLTFNERAIERLEKMDRSKRRIFYREFMRLDQSGPIFRDISREYTT